jgi:hypothetical protein
MRASMPSLWARKEAKRLIREAIDRAKGNVKS